MAVSFAQRTQWLKASEIREILKITQQPDMISFAGGLPAPELFPVEEMKEISDLNLKDLSLNGRELFTSNGEMGIHGYNHNPYLYYSKDVDFKGLNYLPWESQENMGESAKELLKYVKGIKSIQTLRRHLDNLTTLDLITLVSKKPLIRTISNTIKEVLD